MSRLSRSQGIHTKVVVVLRWTFIASFLALVTACDPSSTIPPVQLNPDVGLSHVAQSSKLDPARVTPTQQTQVTVRAMLLAERVTRQLPREVNTRFSSAIGYVWGWLELSNRGPERELLLRWERDHQVRGEFSFVASEGQKMRTWTRLMLRPEDAGEWSLALLDASDRVPLQTAYFEVYQPELAEEPVPYVNLTSPSAPSAMKERALPLSSAQSLKVTREQSANQPEPTTAQAQTPQEASTSPAEVVEGVSEVRRLVVSRSVKHRRPIGVSDRFPGEVDRLWGYVEVRHSGPPTLLLMEWWREGELRSRLKVRVAESLRWRTWSWQRLRPQRDAGHWTLKVLSPDKTLLSETPFFVESL